MTTTDLRAVSACPRSGGNHSHYFTEGADACTGCGITRDRVRRGGWGSWDSAAGAWVDAAEVTR